jgi:hypothetical protein
MVRDKDNDLSSNANSTPVIAFQSNTFVRDTSRPPSRFITAGSRRLELSQTTYSSMSASTIRSPTFRSSTRTPLRLSVSRAIVLTSNSPHLFRT